MLEKEMRLPVATWMQRAGFLPMTEMQTYHIADMIGIRYSPRVGRRIPAALEIIAVELKLTDVSGVIAQALNNAAVCERSYAAMPSLQIARMRLQSFDKFKTAGIGLLGVDGDDVREFVAAAVHPVDPAKGWRRANVIRNHWRRSRAGDWRLTPDGAPV